MAISPNTDNYTLGKGVVFFDQLISGVYQGERDLGNAPAFTFNIALEKLEHYSSRGGLKAKDKEIISQITPGLAFTLDEINKENIALLTLGSTSVVTQAIGVATEELLAVKLDKRVDLDYRGIEYWVLPYDTGTFIFVVGEVVTGAGGASGTVVGLAAGSDATSGTLYIAKSNATAFVDDEAITGDGTGAAAVASTTGGTLGTGTPIVLVQDAATNLVTYVAGTDYVIDTTLSDDAIGRIKWLSGGTVTEGLAVDITYGYSALTYTMISTFANTQVNGKLRFVSDNPAGTQQELEVWSVSLTPSGDTALIGDDWSTLGFTGEILKDETNHPTNPYMQIIMDQVLT